METERSRSLDLEDGTLVFVESVHPAPRMVIVGAVDTSEAVCQHRGHPRLADGGDRPAGQVRDARAAADARRRSSSPGPTRRTTASGVERADSVIVLTHDPKVDDPAISEALRRGASYVGALGSRRTQAKRRERLAESGVPEADLDRIHGPVGLDIGADTPQETAVSIVAEVIAAPGRAQRAQPRRHHGPHPRNRRRGLTDADRERVHGAGAGGRGLPADARRRARRALHPGHRGARQPRGRRRSTPRCR